MDADLQLALKLHRELNSDTSPIPGKKIKKSRSENETSIVNPEWEITDPNPDIHSLFQVFDKKYFWGRLDCIEVKWSPRMYSCAGICTYKGKWGGCVISLSLPLLKLRPRKDLVETLLHEMIHAFLFVADKNRDRGEHGPKFHEHMHRINKEAGTKITVYHSFHDEVKHYKQHWWRCNGPCQERKPFFGLVKRSMNRAPGPNDFWFADHQAKCGGEFIKIKEPENFKSRKARGEKKSEKSKDNSNKSKGPSNLLNFFSGVPRNGILTSEINSPQMKAGDSGKNTSTQVKSIKNNNTSAKVENHKKIRNVHGFTNLSKPGQSPTPNSSTPKGPLGIGATGLKSNKGGTLLLNPKSSTSTSNNKEEKKDELLSPESNFVAFSGSGHKLNSSMSAPTLAESRTKFLDMLIAKSHPSGEAKAVIKPSSSKEGELVSKAPSLSKKRKTPSSDRQSSEGNILKNRLLDCKNYILDSEDESEIPHRNENSVRCPVCNKEMPVYAMNEHLDSCVTLDSVFESSRHVDLTEDLEPEDEAASNPLDVNCPSCGFACSQEEINYHLDICLN